MTGLVWSIVLAAVGIVGLLMAGSKHKVGWLVGVFAQFLWVLYAFATYQYGFLISASVYSLVYGRNYLLWWREERAHAPARSDS